MKNLNNKLLKAFGLTILCWMVSFSVMAQTPYGFSPVGTAGTCISSDNTNQFEYQLTLPGLAPFSSYSNKHFTAVGGIEISGFNEDSSHVFIRSKIDDSPASGYVKYAKGRIYFSCKAPEDTLCSLCPYYNPNFSFYYDVYKLFPLTKPLNPIVGPICVSHGDTVTYSVKPWVSVDKAGIGIDRYKWDLPTTLIDTVLYYSADSSSISFVVNQVLGADTIKAQIGRCNFDDPGKFTWLALNQAAPKPEIQIPTTCIKGGVDTITASIQNPVSGLVYTWSCQPQWKIIGSDEGTSVQIETHRYLSSDIYVAGAYEGASGGCAPSLDTLSVKRGLNNTISTITTTPNTTCFTAGTTYTFSVGNTDATKFRWSHPHGWTVIGTDSVSSSIRLKPETTALSGNVWVIVDPTICTLSDTVFYAVNVKPGTPNAIIGQTCVDRGTAYGYKVDVTTVIPTTSTYTWTVPSGWTINNGQGTDSITVTPSGNTTGNITVTPTRIAGCNGTSKTLAVKFNPVQPTGITSSTTCVNAGLAGTVTYTVTSSVTGQNYGWNIPSTFGSIQSANSDSSQIVVNTRGFEGTYDVKARAKSTTCENSDWTTLPVSITKENFTVSESVIVPPINSIYYTYPSADWVANHSFEWIYNGSNITNTTYSYSTNTTAFGLLARTDSTFYVTITNLTSGCKTRKTAGVGGFRSGTITNQILDFGSNESNNLLTVSPNPTKSKLTIRLSSDGDMNIWIADLSGNIVRNLMEKSNKTTIDVSDLVDGTYIVVAYQGINRYSKQVIIKK